MVKSGEVFMRGFAFLVLSALAAPAWAVPGWLPPGEAPAPFRPDRVALEAGEMKEAARRLAVLAQRPDAASPEELRATAQLLALSRRLDPASGLPGEVGKRLREEEAPPVAGRGELEEARDGLLEALRWLSDGKAGAESRKLAALLLDPLSRVAPADELVGKHDLSGEAGRWRGIVPPAEAYREALAAATRPKPPAPEETEKPDVRAALFRHLSLSLRVPLARKSLLHPRKVELMTLRLQVAEDPEKKGLAFQVLPEGAVPEHFRIEREVKRSLARRFSRVPARKTARLYLQAKTATKPNHRRFALPAALLLHGALTEAAFHPKLVVLGQLDAAGKLHRAPHPWAFLRVLRGVEGARVLVPPGSGEDLAAFLADGNAGFFLLNEVFEAPDMESLRALATAGDDPPETRKALALFHGFRRSATPATFRSVLTQSVTRSRLRQMKEADARFLNPDFLLLLGLRKSPSKYPSRILAEELDLALLSLHPVVIKPLQDCGEESLRVMEQDLAKDLQRIERLAGIPDRELIESAKSVLSRLRSFARDARPRPRQKLHERIRKSAKSFEALKEQYRETRRLVAKAAGERTIDD